MRSSTFLKSIGLFNVIFFASFVWAAIQQDVGVFTQSVKIGGTTVANSKAALDISSITKGILFPRMTQVQRDAISTPPTGLLVFNTDTAALNIYDGAAWAAVGSGGGGSLPLTTLGDTVYEDSTPTPVRLAGNTTTTKKYLSQTGTGTISAAPAWAQPAFSDLSGSATAAQLPNPGASSLGGVQSKAVVATNFLTGISTSGVVSAAQPAFTDLSGNIAVTQMNSGTSASSTTYWRGDGTWATPAGSGSITGPGTSTDTAFARWSGTGGATLQDSVFTGASTGILSTTGDTSGVKMVSTTDTTSSATVGIDHTSTSLLLKTLESSTNTGYNLGLSTANIAGANANATGSVSVTTGNKTAGTGNSGGITLTTGTTVGGTRGRIAFADGSEGNSPGAVWTISGNGGGGHWVSPPEKNYIANPDANIQSSSTTPAGWANYFDAAGTSPVDCTGGSPVTALTRNTTTPIGPTTDFRWTKSATSRQGEGFSYDFTIDSTDQAKVMKVAFDYSIISGTFVPGTSTTDSDVTVWLYDVTNAQIIQPSTYKLYSTTASPPTGFDTTFQTNSNSTAYRLCVHTGSTSASAYTLAFRNFEAKRARYTYGTPITEWTSYTPTFTGLGTVTSANFIWRRAGSSLEVEGFATAGTTTGVEARISFPTGLTSASTLPTIGTAGVFTRAASGSFTNFALREPSVSYFTWGDQDSTHGGLTKATGTVAVGSAENFSIRASVPIQGWNTTSQTSDSAPQSVISFSGTQVSQSVTASVTNIAFTAVKDSAGAWNGTQFVVPVPGDYVVSGSGTMTASATLFAYKNGVSSGAFSTAATGVISAGSVLVTGCVAGDLLSIRSGVTTTIASGNIGIFRLSGPVSITATDSVNATYTYVATATGVPNNANTTLNATYGTYTKVFDSHSAFSNGTYTCPISGKFRMTIGLGYTANATGVRYALMTQAGSSSAQYITNSIPGYIGTTNNVSGSATFNCLAGDTLTIIAFQNSGGTLTIGGAAANNYVSIERVGN